MYHFSVLLLIPLVITNIVQVRGDCGERSRLLVGAEDFCWAQKVEIAERISYTQKKIVNFAKKKLGMDDGEMEEPQKCDYYYCIFDEMKLLNPEYDVPCIERTSKWVKKNVVFNDAEILLNQIQMCSGELAEALGSKTNFLADNVGISKSDQKRTGGTQSRCEISSEYMKCLANAQNLECPAFQYP